MQFVVILSMPVLKNMRVLYIIALKKIIIFIQKLDIQDS